MKMDLHELYFEQWLDQPYMGTSKKTRREHCQEQGLEIYKSLRWVFYGGFCAGEKSAINTLQLGYEYE